MALRPVKKYSPHYPCMEQVDLNRLLLKHRPNRWKASGTALFLLSALTASQFSGCSGKTVPPRAATRKMQMAPIFEVSSIAIPMDVVVSDLSFQEQKFNITPLGNFPGFGDTLPLTEEAALVIISETLKMHGLSSSISDKKVDAPTDHNNTAVWSFDLDIDGASEPIHAEFIPQLHRDREEELTQRSAMHLPEDAKAAAVELREKLSEVYDNSTGVIFYADEDYSMMPEQNLIEQVNDFVEWLKTMGLI